MPLLMVPSWTSAATSSALSEEIRESGCRHPALNRAHRRGRPGVEPAVPRDAGGRFIGIGVVNLSRRILSQGGDDGDIAIIERLFNDLCFDCVGFAYKAEVERLTVHLNLFFIADEDLVAINAEWACGLGLQNFTDLQIHFMIERLLNHLYGCSIGNP